MAAITKIMNFMASAMGSALTGGTLTTIYEVILHCQLKLAAKLL